MPGADELAMRAMEQEHFVPPDLHLEQQTDCQWEESERGKRGLIEMAAVCPYDIAKNGKRIAILSSTNDPACMLTDSLVYHIAQQAGVSADSLSAKNIENDPNHRELLFLNRMGDQDAKGRVEKAFRDLTQGVHQYKGLLT